MIHVLDSSALFAMEDLPPERCVAPSGVIAELNRYGDPRVARWEGLLQVQDPGTEAIEEVRERARRSGDLGRLSDVDISVLALALELKGVILSDDYSIQNVATIMGLNFMPVGMDAIKEVRRWNYRCLGCGRWYKEKMPECPICGSGMRAHRRR